MMTLSNTNPQIGEIITQLTSVAIIVAVLLGFVIIGGLITVAIAGGIYSFISEKLFPLYTEQKAYTDAKLFLFPKEVEGSGVPRSQPTATRTFSKTVQDAISGAHYCEYPRIVAVSGSEGRKS